MIGTSPKALQEALAELDRKKYTTRVSDNILWLEIGGWYGEEGEVAEVYFGWDSTILVCEGESFPMPSSWNSYQVAERVMEVLQWRLEYIEKS